MSSILNALKKVEGKPAGFPKPSETEARDAAASQAHPGRKGIVLAGAVLLVVVAGIGGKLWYNSTRDAGHTPAAPTVATAPAPAATAAAPTATAAAPSVVPVRPPAPPQTPPAPEKTVRPSPEPHPPLAEVRNAVETTQAPQPPPKTIAAPPEEIPEPPASKRQETPASSEVQPPKGMSIQALVWSEQRTARFAVINGSIVREGERVSDAVVTEILKDSVRFTSSRGIFSLKRGQTP